MLDSIGKQKKMQNVMNGNDRKHKWLQSLVRIIWFLSLVRFGGRTVPLVERATENNVLKTTK